MSLELARSASDQPIPAKIGRPYPNSQWTPEKVEQLIAMFHEGLSCEIIGRRLGTTRNAVIGRLHRMGYTKPQPTTKIARVPKRAEGSSDGRGVVIRFRPHMENFQQRAAAVVPLHIGLVDLQSHHCRYPYGEGPYSFCGHKKADGSSYCPEHFALTWRGRE